MKEIQWKKELCINCKTNTVEIKKRKLCRKCCAKIHYREYKERMGKFRDKEGLPTPIMSKMYCSEIEFIKHFFTHNNWIFHPASFNLNGERYHPDFYDGKRNTFIEVSGTRQAFFANFDKYKLFVEIYPKIKFEIRNVLGELKSLTKKSYAKKTRKN